MSNPTEVLSVKAFLKEQSIAVSSEWLQACISFLKGEHGRNLSLQQLKNFVYQQWLNADLEEIGICSFGSACKNLLTTQKITLTGKFALQVEGIRDVGKPAYAQLKELESSEENSNAEFSAAPPPTQAPWEAKPTRMLMLKLTDGCSHVQGMEYRTINTLSPNLAPGLKVLVQGPIDCRFGVLMLTPEKIKVLGGEVEDKLLHNSRKSILKGILGIPLEENGDETPVASSSRPSTQNDDFSSNSSLSTATNQTSQNQTSFNSRQQNIFPQRVQSSSTSNGVASSSRPSTQNDDFSSNSSLSTASNQTTQNQTSFNSRQQNTFSPRVQSSSTSNGTNGFQQSSWHNATNEPRNDSFGQERNQNRSNSLDDFENEDDDFDLNVDPSILDELEREGISKSQGNETTTEDHDDVWLEDDDVMQEMMSYQDENSGFEMPMMAFEEEVPQQPSIQSDEPFTYLISVLAKKSPDCIITVKAFIISVLSKLECTSDKKWSLMVKINDGTATLDVNIHDEVLENIMGISAPVMVKMKLEAAENAEMRKKVGEAITKCTVTLRDFNCLMTIKFSPGCIPCLIKYRAISQLDRQQLLERVRASLKN